MEPTVIEIGWGAYIPAIAAIIAAVVMAAFALLVSNMPDKVQDLVKTLQVEQLVKRAVDYGVNSAVGATKGAKLTVPVGNEVIAFAANYALNEGASKVVEYAGGVEGIKRKILARLDLEPDASENSMNVSNVPRVTR